jgi:glutamate 5-kinase
MAGGAGSSVGTGGMQTKIQAAQRCTASGIQTLIVNGKDPEVFSFLAEGRCKGTLFTAQDTSNTARSEWLKHTLKSKGRVHIDSGAAHALVNQGASLLPRGLVSVSGDFQPGDAVDVMHDNLHIGKGIALFSSQEMQHIKGHHSDQIERILGYTPANVVIHRDNLIIL